MKAVYRVLFALHLFVGIGAVFGGMAAILNPKTPLGAPAEILNNSPFSDFLIPGIILFSIVGLGNIFSAVTMKLKSRFQGYISSVFTWGIVFWIIVQCIMLRAVAFPHVLFFFIGLAGAGLSAIIMFKQQLFPANIVLNIYKKMNKTV